MNPTAQLREEHKGIKVMLDILGEVCKRLDAGKDVDPRHLIQIVDFLKVFVDKCHHAKEEELLFPEMEKAGVSRNGGPIGIMLSEHDEGRRNIRRMSEAAAQYERGIRNAADPFVENAHSYIHLLREHIEKEDNILYPLADRRLTEKVRQDLSEGFEKVEEERIGHGKHEEFHRLMDQLKAIYLP